MIATRMRRWLSPLARTPLHPQWLVLNRNSTLTWAGNLCLGRVLDIGCGEARLRPRLASGCQYIGLDYPTTRALGYRGQANLLADGARLPIGDAHIDTVVLLDVLEHVRHPGAVLEEARRVLRPGGRILVQTPFLYPLHDEPHDYRRWTAHGLRAELEAAGFAVDAPIEPTAHGLETAAALLCVGLARSGIDAIERRSPAVALLPLFALAIPLINLGGWLLARAFPKTTFMPAGYRLTGSLASSAARTAVTT